MHLAPDDAAQWLSSVGYYRLSGYWYPYRRLRVGGQRGDDFVEGTQFEDVARLYEFDRKLRTLIHDGIERIEVALRQQVSSLIGRIDPLAYKDPHHFRPDFDHAHWLNTTQRRVERAKRHSEPVRHHQRNYGGELPIWVLADLLDFADVSQLVEGLPAKQQWDVAKALGVKINRDALSKSQRKKVNKNHPLARWCEQLTVVRNTCAHHSRVWNRSFVPAGTNALRTDASLESLPEGQSERLYGALAVMAAILLNICPGTTWPAKVRKLVTENFINLQGRSVGEMGFPEDWHQHALWAD